MVSVFCVVYLDENNVVIMHFRINGVDSIGPPGKVDQNIFGQYYLSAIVQFELLTEPINAV